MTILPQTTANYKIEWTGNCKQTVGQLNDNTANDFSALVIIYITKYLGYILNCAIHPVHTITSRALLAISPDCY